MENFYGTSRSMVRIGGSSSVHSQDVKYLIAIRCHKKGGSFWLLASSTFILIYDVLGLPGLLAPFSFSLRGVVGPLVWNVYILVL